jgi:hypothetical protein
VVGFYTDSKGRTRPITRRKGKVHLPKFYIPMRVQLPKPLVEDVITNILLQVPMVKEIYTAYVIADSLYTNWDSITQLFEEYQGGSIQSVARKIGTETARTALSSVQTEVIWATIGGYIPKEYQNIGKEILANFMNTVTTAEIALAKQFLQERG